MYQKVTLLGLAISFALHSNAQSQSVDSLDKKLQLQEVIVSGVNAKSKDPITFTNINKKEIAKGNFGQDLPFLLNLSPSTVVNSDAGAGIGYTGIRIRGTDPTRINVTINGVPVNDAESHGTFWVNMPDLASSVQQIQVQRGVGTSQNGAAAFGASINIQTDATRLRPYAELNNSFGSFNTRKHTIMAGTGLLSNGWSIDARLSKLNSDGFIDRASSDLKSFYTSASRYGKKSLLKMVVFSGKEITYQAWNGVPESELKKGNRTFNEFTYTNQTDNYQQDYYQLFYTYNFSKHITANIGLHYTRGRGFYEEYRTDETFTTYKLKDSIIVNGDTITSGDFIRRRWLDNDFYGTVFSLNYSKNKWNVLLGGGINQYDGRHFGELVWAQYTQNSSINQRFYEGKSTKRDANVYIKAAYQLTDKLESFVDLQQRQINYRLLGVDLNSGVYYPYNFDLNYSFFNPKAGLTYQLNNHTNLYAYIGVANKEPVRNDIIQASNRSVPQAERLINYEFGFRKNWQKSALTVNLYYMDYYNQLITTGQINDVGAYNRVNVPNSYRAGIEITGGVQLLPKLNWQATLTYSQNKIRSFNEFLDDWDNGTQIIIPHSNTRIAFSPDWIASSIFSFTPFKQSNIDLITKYVGEQYLDNTENKNRMLQSFLVNDIRMGYVFVPKNYFSEIGFNVLLNNILDVKYEPNGYTYSGFSGGVRTDYNFYYPQAGRNFLLNVTLKF